jgi:hypothetical protein
MCCFFGGGGTNWDFHDGVRTLSEGILTRESQSPFIHQGIRSRVRVSGDAMRHFNYAKRFLSANNCLIRP